MSASTPGLPTYADRIPVYFDCDTGIDDALALAYLMAAPGIDLVGVGSVSGNVETAVGARNTLALLELGGRTDVPVAVGAHDMLATAYEGAVPHIHGHNGIGDVVIPDAARGVEAESAVEMLIRLSHEHEGRLRVLAVGPFTNLALALQADPTLPERVESVVVMGGAALVPGNVAPAAEANIFNDPEAAALVVAAAWPVHLVGLDITMKHSLSEDDRERLLASDKPLPRALGEILDLYFEFYNGIYGYRTCALHDPLAAAIAAGGVIETVAPAVPVVVDDTPGPGRGQTICDMRSQEFGIHDRRGANVRVVLEVDQPLAPHLMDVILSA